MNSEEQSEMIRVLDKLVGVVGILIIPIGLLLFGQQFFFSGASFSKSITSMVAAVIGNDTGRFVFAGQCCSCCKCYATLHQRKFLCMT